MGVYRMWGLRIHSLISFRGPVSQKSYSDTEALMTAGDWLIFVHIRGPKKQDSDVSEGCLLYHQ